VNIRTKPYDLATRVIHESMAEKPAAAAIVLDRKQAAKRAVAAAKNTKRILHGTVTTKPF